MRSLSQFLLCVSLLAGALLLSGCDAQAKKQRYVQRGDEFFAKKDFERARLEYLNAFRLQPDNPHVVVQLALTLFERGEVGPAKAFLIKARDLQATNLTVRANLASLYLLGGNIEEARAEGEYILQQDPAHGEGLVIVAGSAFTTNDISATKERFTSLLSKDPNNAWLHLALGNLHLKSRDMNAAEAAFKKGESLEPKSPRFQLALANTYWFQGQTNQADARFQAAAELAPIKSGERLRWADFKIKTGQIAEGKRILREAVDQSADFVPALNGLAEVALAEKNYDEAASRIQKVLEQEPNNYAALMNRARLNLLKGDMRAAITDLETLTKLYPSDHNSQFQLALAHLNNSNDTANASAALDKAITLNTNFVDAKVIRAEMQIARGDSAAAIPTLVEITRKHPQVSRAHYLLARAYAARGTLDDALAVYLNVQALFPRDPQAPYLAATIYRQQNKLDLARQGYERAIEISPAFVPPVDDIIELDLYEKKSDQALARVKTYIEKYPKNPTPYFLEAKILAGLNRFADAEKALNKCLEVNPNYDPGHKALAQLYIAAGRTDEALNMYNQMVAKNPSDARALHKIGMIHESTGNKAEAREAYEKAIAANPKFHEPLNNLAYMLSEDGTDLPRAVELARAARQLSNDPYTADTLGWIEFKTGDYNRALQLVTESIQKLGAVPDLLYHFGMAHYMLGNETAARSALEPVVKTTPPITPWQSASNALAVLNLQPASLDAPALAFLEQRVRDSKDHFAQVRMAEYQAHQKDFDKAQASFEAALRASPKAAATVTRFARFMAESANNKTRALELARQARAISPLPAYALDLAAVGVSAGDPRWALPLLLEAQQHNPTNSRVAYFNGLANYAIGRIAIAQESFQSAAASTHSFPEKEVARLTSAALAVHTDASKAPQAESAATQLLAGKPNFAPALVALGLVAETQQNLAAAQAHYQKALESYPNLVPAQRQLAILLSEKLADDNQAFDLASKARAQAPDDPELSKILGKILYRRGDFRESARLLKDSLARAPRDDADLLYHLGMAQFKMQDTEARQSLTRALSLDKSQKLAPDAEKALAELKK